MDIEALKDKLGDQFEPLKAHIADLTGQRDAARRESADGRVGLKKKVSELDAALTKALNKLGADSVEDLDELPDAKGAADAARQAQAQAKRLEKQLAEVAAERDRLSGDIKAARVKADIAAAVSKHGFLDDELVGEYLSRRTEFNGDAPMFKTDDGRLIPLAEGAALIASTKKHLLKASGAGGSGHVPAAGRGAVVNPWAKASLNLTEQVRIAKENPQLAEQLKTAAQAA